MIQYVTIDNGTYARYLSHANLNPTIYLSTDSPARVYNKFIRKSESKYICFIHSDVSTVGLTEAIERTIAMHPDFGALGAVGVNKGYIWGSPVREVVTLDSCCLVINTDHGLWFDEITFDSFHLFVEDYCMQTRALGLKNYTLDLNAYEHDLHNIPIEPYFVHNSHTCNVRGYAWGDYPKYKKLLKYKWIDVETT